jgi:Transposase DNA-binding/Transposase DDE domain
MSRPSWIEAEFEGLSLGDKRRERRALSLVRRAAVAPSSSFPVLLPESAELEGAYRFFQNEAVSHLELLQPHLEASLKRIRQQRIVRVAHDTTGLSFGGTREGLGALGGGGCGFWAHMALAISGGEERAPLGVVGLETKVYPTLEEKDRLSEQRRRKYIRSGKVGDLLPPVAWKRVDKWSAIPLRLVGETPGTRVVHVMDREADDTALMSLLLEHRIHFVIRGSDDRRVRSPPGEQAHVSDKLAGQEVRLRRSVRLEARPKSTPGHAKRPERNAALSVRATRVSLAPAAGNRLTLNVVEVFEPKPPAGEEAVNWVLYTDEPVDTPEQVAAVVDHYRARWRIEEFFKALKTGCSIEKRQLTDYEALLRALALFIPVAWHLLALRTAAHAERPVGASSLLSELQLTVLRALVLEKKIHLPEAPTVREVLWAIAAAGGHLKRNGDPGWLTIGRGYDKLRIAEVGWTLAAAQFQRSDQS